MNKSITIECEVEQEKYDNYKLIVERTGRTIKQTILMLIDKTINRNDIEWLYSDVTGEVKTKNTKKKNAIELFNKIGYRVTNYNSSFMSKNNGHDKYWANPPKRVLTEDWYLILDDNVNKKLHLLYVPRNSITRLKEKNDKQYNVQIAYNDPDYTESFSRIQFVKYFKETITYKSLV